jgi:hypothetical protein
MIGDGRLGYSPFYGQCGWGEEGCTKLSDPHIPPLGTRNERPVARFNSPFLKRPVTRDCRELFREREWQYSLGACDTGAQAVY